MMQRDGNILSVTIRDAWDKGDLHPLTKTSRIKATGAHISIIGHITRRIAIAARWIPSCPRYPPHNPPPNSWQERCARTPKLCRTTSSTTSETTRRSAAEREAQ
jgi:hypothetical protein